MRLHSKDIGENKLFGKRQENLFHAKTTMIKTMKHPQQQIFAHIAVENENRKSRL